MSEPELPQDRELEEFLAGRSSLSGAYRVEAGQQGAPAALNAAVLADAASQTNAAAVKVRRVQRWRLPLTMAASMLVIVGVLRLASVDPVARPGESTPAPPSPTTEKTAEPAAVATSDDTKLPASTPKAAPAAKRADRANAPPALPAQKRRAAEAPATALPSAPQDAESRPDAMRGASAATAQPESGPASRKAGTAASAWQAARYRGLRLGQATLADVDRLLGASAESSAIPAMQPSEDGNAEPLSRNYPSGVDLRGPMKLHFDADSRRLLSVTVNPQPTLALKTVEAQEQLQGPASSRAAAAPPCGAGDRRPESESYRRYRVYPAQGIYLLLTASDQVAEIVYLERCR